MRVNISKGYGIAMHSDPNKEITSMEESFEAIDSKKYIGINVLHKLYKEQSLIQFVSYEKFLEAFNEVVDTTPIEYIEDNRGPDWYVPYEDTILAVIAYLYPNTTEINYSMDLARAIEAELERRPK